MRQGKRRAEAEKENIDRAWRHPIIYNWTFSRPVSNVKHNNDKKTSVEGIKIIALQNCSYKESQDKEPIYGAGFVKAHAMGRGKRKFELDFEVKELNQSVVEEPTSAPRSKTTQLKVVKIGGAEG